MLECLFSYLSRARKEKGFTNYVYPSMQIKNEEHAIKGEYL
jgi:hypothetical protein